MTLFSGSVCRSPTVLTKHFGLTIKTKNTHVFLITAENKYYIDTVIIIAGRDRN
jgi:hypothetical protein